MKIQNNEAINESKNILDAYCKLFLPIWDVGK